MIIICSPCMILVGAEVPARLWYYNDEIIMQVKNDDLLDYFDPGSSTVNTQSSPKSFPGLKQALVDASALKLAKSNETKEEEGQPSQSYQYKVID